MNISLPGNSKVQTPQTVLPEDSRPAAEAPRRESPSLVVSETGANPETAGIPASELEKAVTRTDELGGLVDKALADVPTDTVDKVVEMLLEADYKAKKAVIDNLKPSEREKQVREDQKKRVEKEAEERAFEELEEARRLDQQSGYPGGLQMSQLV